MACTRAGPRWEAKRVVLDKLDQMHRIVERLLRYLSPTVD